MYLQHHVLAQFLVHREHIWVVRVKSVHHRVQLDALDSRLPKPPHLVGLGFQARMNGAEWDEHVVLNADQPIVGPAHLVWALGYPQYHRFVHARLGHMGFEPGHSVGGDGLKTTVPRHCLQGGLSDLFRPYVGVDIDAHGERPPIKLQGWDNVSS